MEPGDIERVGAFVIDYGERLVEVHHPQLTDPVLISVNDTDTFWDEFDEVHRQKLIFDKIDDGIDWLVVDDPVTLAEDIKSTQRGLDMQLTANLIRP